MALRAFAAVVTFASVVLLFELRSNESVRVITGIVTRVSPETITVLSDRNDPRSMVLSLREEGAYSTRIQPGSAVRVWWTRGADRYPVARKIVVVRAER